MNELPRLRFFPTKNVRAARNFNFLSFFLGPQFMEKNKPWQHETLAPRLVRNVLTLMLRPSVCVSNAQAALVLHASPPSHQLRRMQDRKLQSWCIDPRMSRPRAPEQLPPVIAPGRTRPQHARTPYARLIARVWVWVGWCGCGGAITRGIVRRWSMDVSIWSESWLLK